MTLKYDIDARGKRKITQKTKKATRSSASTSHKAMARNSCIQKHAKCVGCDMR